MSVAFFPPSRAFSEVFHENVMASKLDAATYVRTPVSNTASRIDFDNLDLGDFTQDDADELERQLEAMMASAGSTPEVRALDARRFDIGGLLSALKGIFRGVPRKREE
jgi:hypothetical protein